MIIAAYLLGSVSSAVLICRLLRLPDPRTVGSNNPGATNVLRIGGKGAAVGVLLCDMLKGTIPVWSGYYLGIDLSFLVSLRLLRVLGTCTYFLSLQRRKRSRDRTWRDCTYRLGSHRTYHRHLATGCCDLSLFVLSGHSHCFACTSLHLDGKTTLYASCCYVELSYFTEASPKYSPIV